MAKSKKPIATKASKKVPAAKRHVKPQAYRSFRLQKRIKHSKPRVQSTWSLFRASLRLLKKNWVLFLGIVLIYLLLTIVMVKGLGVSVGVRETKETLNELFTGNTGKLLTSLTIFGVLLGSTSSAANDVANVYQSILLVITSLAVIWALRQTFASEKTSIRESFYKGMYPLVPFILVLLVIGLQLIPVLVANWLYAATITQGIAVTAIEKGLAYLLIGLLVLLSLYMVSSSIFALYIVTLPNMTPVAALRSARELVRYRRWMVMRRILFLPVMLLLFGALIMIPIILLLTPAAEWVYFVLSTATLAVVHTYMYSLYRELL